MHIPKHHTNSNHTYNPKLHLYKVELIQNGTTLFELIYLSLEVPISDSVRIGVRRRGPPAVESHWEPGEGRDGVESGEGRDGVASGEASPPPCCTIARVEAGEPEARPKGAVLEHPVPYMFESKLATLKAQYGSNN